MYIVSTVEWSRMVSELSVITSYKFMSNAAVPSPLAIDTYLYWSHDCFNVLCI